MTGDDGDGRSRDEDGEGRWQVAIVKSLKLESSSERTGNNK